MKGSQLMKKWFYGAFGLWMAGGMLVLGLAGCATLSDPAIPAAKVGATYYTQFSLFEEGGEHITTNYRRGILVPINTQVRFVDADSRKIVVERLDTGGRLTLVNVPEYSGENIRGIFHRTLAESPVDLEAFTPLERDNIKGGTIALGMSKDAVLRSLGYPPKHKTPTLESNVWRYWRHRLGSYLVRFADGKVVDVDPPHHLMQSEG